MHQPHVTAERHLPPGVVKIFCIPIFMASTLTITHLQRTQTQDLNRSHPQFSNLNPGSKPIPHLQRTQSQDLNPKQKGSRNREKKKQRKRKGTWFDCSRSKLLSFSCESRKDLPSPLEEGAVAVDAGSVGDWLRSLVKKQINWRSIFLLLLLLLS